MFFLLSYRCHDSLACESVKDGDGRLNDVRCLDEQAVRADLAGLLSAAVTASGRKRGEIATATGLHKDALRRVLVGTRSATIAEAMRILAACGLPSHAPLMLMQSGCTDQAVSWLDSDAARFLDSFTAELPGALEEALGAQLHNIKPRWAKGTAQRVARLLSDHMDELEKRDSLYLYAERA